MTSFSNNDSTHPTVALHAPPLMRSWFKYSAQYHGDRPEESVVGCGYARSQKVVHMYGHGRTVAPLPTRLPNSLMFENDRVYRLFMRILWTLKNSLLC